MTAIPVEAMFTRLQALESEMTEAILDEVEHVVPITEAREHVEAACGILRKVVE